MKISIEAAVNAPIESVWQAWTTPSDIESWNAASSEWHCPSAEINLSPGGAFCYRMEAKDGSVGFDFVGKFTKVEPHKLIEYSLEDERPVSIEFIVGDGAVVVRESFEAESETAGEQQRQGWQAILNNFAKHVEQKGN